MFLGSVLLNSAICNDAQSYLYVPAHAAYSTSEKVPIDPKGIGVWNDQYKVRITWIGYLAKGHVFLKLDGAGRFDWSLGNDSVKGKPWANFDVRQAGYYKLVINPAKGWHQGCFGFPAPIKGLELSGPAVVGAKFNLKERRNAPSVHLKYPLQPEEKVEWFYNEIRPQTDNPATYYQACGFHRGYFGIQVNSPKERRIIFSVWDSGDVPDDRAKVKKEDLVTCLEKGEDVVAEGFGNEGTGGHSHLVYNWKTKDVHRFLVHAQPDGDKTIYTGYYWFNETKKWGLIAKFRAPKDGSYMKGLYSFNENFWGDNGDQLFAARFGPGWVRKADGDWRELTNATFSCDKTGREDRFDYSAGTKDGLFFLTNGGAVANGVKYGDPLVRPASKTGPPKYLP
jgi:hypothetical protein